MRKHVALPPYPDGWYSVGLSRELKAGEIRSMRFMGEEVVLFRTQSGKVCMMDAYCPHLGGHFGFGGKVINENIQCPFHGFCFDTTGECVSTPYGTKPPPSAVAKTWTTLDINGFVLAYHSSQNLQPEWHIPKIDFTGWTSLLSTSFNLQSHPQETTENSVDIGHFSVVHGYTDVDTIKPLHTDGAYLTAKYVMHRKAGFIGKTAKIRAEFEVHVYGLGYSFVEAEIPQYGLQYRNFVLATPTEAGKVNLRLGLSMKKVSDKWKVNPALALLPAQLVNAIIQRATFKGYIHDVMQDFAIWENKIYVAPPALAKGDGPVGKYRQWAKQFYPAYNTVTENDQPKIFREIKGV